MLYVLHSLDVILQLNAVIFPSLKYIFCIILGRLLDYVAEPTLMKFPFSDPKSLRVTHISSGRAHTVIATNQGCKTSTCYNMLMNWLFYILLFIIYINVFKIVLSLYIGT